ncbi:MAG: hypothetical protein ACI9QD_000210 [Thermoproteota archaeon]|jgi:hypothetical protein
MFNDDIDFLVSETFNIRPEHTLGQKFAGDTESDLSESLNKRNTPSTISIPNKVGIVYHLQKSSATFVLRSIPCVNMKDLYTDIIAKPEEFKTLRMDERGLECLSFFECDDIDTAQVVHKQLSNRRFLVHEENVCNISDPGFSWWLKPEENGFSFLFNLSHTDSMDNLIKLGPLGDNSSAHAKFQKLYSFFNYLFSVKTFSCSRSGVKMAVESSNCNNFSELMEAFILGEFSFNFLNFLEDKEIELSENDRPNFRSALFFLKELIITRKLWLKLQSQLDD